MARSIYDLELHEEIPVAFDGKERPVCWCRRVPGGWVYTDVLSLAEGDGSFSTVFVPWHNEYQQTNAPDTMEGANLQHTTEQVQNAE